jgi:hypothetical protein
MMKKLKLKNLQIGGRIMKKTHLQSKSIEKN